MKPAHVSSSAINYTPRPSLPVRPKEPTCVYPSVMADALKAEGNKLFAEKKFDEAM